MVKLELLEEKEFSKIVEWSKDKSADFLVQWSGLAYQYPLTVQQMKKHYSKGFNKADSDTYLYKIVLSHSNEMIGSVQLRQIDKVSLSAKIGRFVIGAESMRGKGLGKAALDELVRIGFEDFGLKKLWLNVYDTNERAMKCYEKVGFIKEKHTSNIYKAANGFWGEYNMSICYESWKESKQ